MNRSARSLLSVSVLAAFAVTAAPANPEPGPSTTLLYETAAAAAPVTRTLPEPVTRTAGQTAELTTGAVDGVLKVAPGSPGARSAAAQRCSLNPGKTVNSHAGTSLPDAPLPSAGQGPLGGLPQGDCLPAGRSGRANPLPVPPEAAGKVPGALIKDAGKVGSAVRNSNLGGLPGVDTALPAARADGRRAAVPAGMGVPDVPSTLGSGTAPGLPNVPSMLGAARPGGLPVGPTLFPPAGRHARPGPSDDVVGQANDTVNQVGGEIDRTEDGVGSVVEVLKARDRVANPSDGPLSMPDASGIGLPKLPGTGLPKVPGLR